MIAPSPEQMKAEVDALFVQWWETLKHGTVHGLPVMLVTAAQLRDIIEDAVAATLSATPSVGNVVERVIKEMPQ
jgi:hypothetical protein